MKQIKLLLCLLCMVCMIGISTDAFSKSTKIGLNFSQIDNSDAPDGMKKADLFEKYKSKDSFGKDSKGTNEMADKMKKYDTFNKK